MYLSPSATKALVILLVFSISMGIGAALEVYLELINYGGNK